MDKIDRRPKPMVSHQHRFVVVWSPKSACTSATIWFMTANDHLDAMQAYGRWPHDYRIQVYYHLPEITKGMGGDLLDYFYLKIIRDPFSRVVSSFKQGIHTGYLNNNLARYLGRQVDDTHGYSFTEFLDYLETIDLANTNPHHGLQRHPVEDVRDMDCVINVSTEDLYEGLNRFEDRMGLPQTNFAEFDLIHQIQNRRKSKLWDIGTADVSDLPISKNELRQNGFFSPELLLNDHNRSRIRSLYAVDLEQYRDYL